MTNQTTRATWVLSGSMLVCLTAWLALAAGAAKAPTSLPTATGPASRPARVLSIDELREVTVRLRPLHKTLGKPRPGDWLAHHREPGQTFEQYVACRPTLPRGKRHVLYIQPLGTFTAPQRKVVRLTSEFMGLYFNLPVKISKDLPPTLVPARARRVHPQWGDKQILTTYVLDEVLLPRLPDDAAALLAFTASDLWPGQGWNFVFGQASLRQRVGVWSIYRNGNPARGGGMFRTCLLRTMKTAVHETGHMFSMLHCTAFDCCMCGSNNRGESDRRPVALCPQCLAKVCWATGTDPRQRYDRLARFCRKQGLVKEARFYMKSARVLAR